MDIDLFESKLPEIRQFLIENIDCFNNPIRVRHNDWPKILKTLEDSGMGVDIFHGKCYPIAHFLLFLMGGKKANKLELQMCKPIVYCMLPNGNELKTTHWWVRDTKTLKIYDLTASQFIYGVSVEEFYKVAIKGDVRYPYFRIKQIKSEIFNENVPTKVVLKLAQKFKDQFGTAYGLDIWLDRLKQFRRSNGS